ncbi:hypothetical protein ABZY81_34890 [Streptomyces sp. NPDC006514]|uniref:hypothetical protein n=1 Tax=Streptomyces sp. NPDC006514 TaxID=3154308 RepID=UPI0033B1649E
MRTKLLLGLATAALLASPLAAGTASAATDAESALTAVRSCPPEQTYDDISCTMAYNGSSWYKGDWVAVHRSQSGGTWVNGYSNKSGVFRVLLRNGNGSSVRSDWTNGNTGQGASAGRVSTVPALTGTIEINGGASRLTVNG